MLIDYEQCHDNIYIVSTPFKLLGANIGNRMTVIKVSNGTLWLHSPVALSDELLKKVQDWGPVAALIAPNLFHYLHIKDWSNQLSIVPVYGVSGLESKVSDLTINPITQLSDPSISFLQIEGMPKANEMVFFHHPSKTLIVTDLLFHLNQARGWSRVLFSAYGINKLLVTTKLFRMLIKDKHKFKQSIKTMLEWDIERVIMSHGSIISTQAKQAIQKSFDWLL